MMLNDAGKMIKKWYFELQNKFSNVRCREYAIMPNHIHSIIVNVGADLQCVIQWFKTMTTNEYIRNVQQHNWHRFTGKLWQRGYYEHVIRNHTELNNIREYIKNNPLNFV